MVRLVMFMLKEVIKTDEMAEIGRRMEEAPITIGSNPVLITKIIIWPGDGIDRHDRFKICCSNERVGLSPTWATKFK